jgi:hypothetical protein
MAAAGLITSWRGVGLAFLLATIGAVSTGCYSVVYSTKATPAPEPQTEWNHHTFWGLGITSEVQVNDICAQGVARIEVKHSFVSMLLSGLTLGIYSPTVTEIWCAAGHAEERPIASGEMIASALPTGGAP